MSDDALSNQTGPTALRRTSDGRLPRGSFWDRRTWRDSIANGEAPALVLIGAFVVVAFSEIFTGGPARWGLSGQAISEGRWFTIGTHMFAHAGLYHLLMNCSGLLALTPVVFQRFGRGVSGWLRYGGLYGLSGLVAAATYLALHPTGTIPMVGASGAICGLWGAVTRIGENGVFVPIRSRQVWLQIKAFVINNAILFGILLVLVLMSGGKGGLAWEAHVGGFVFGLLAAPWLAPGIAAGPDETSEQP
jgi:membrane associated rhomboid family serine protease